MSKRFWRNLKFLAVALPLVAIGLNACIVVPERPVYYGEPHYYWHHDRDYWGRGDWR
ncbi:MAG TPA: hypothetical protein VEU47_08085 [Candidatus Cybelea sp.]|nr:hypothetical protein [Candidatus Cybelea sp.]